MTSLAARQFAVWPMFKPQFRLADDNRASAEVPCPFAGSAALHGILRPATESAIIAVGQAVRRVISNEIPMDQGPTGVPAKRRAFLLEDNDANGFVIGGMLELIGYEEVVWVKTIADVAAYEREILEGGFAILLIDIMLPDGESFGLLDDLKSKGVKRVCVYTARSSSADYARYNAIGCDHVFEKPLTLDSFTSGHDALFHRRRRN